MEIEVKVNGEKNKFGYISDAIEYLKEIDQNKRYYESKLRALNYFKKFPFVKGFYGGAIGTYFKYELAGKTYEKDYLHSDVEYYENHEFFDNINEANKIEVIAEAMDYPYICPWILLDDFPKRGGKIIYTENLGDSVSFTLEDYDPE